MAHDSTVQAAPDITCREVAAWTSAYLDEHMADSSKVRMALHLATCAGCQTYVQQIRAVRELLKALPAQDPEFSHRERLLKAFTGRPIRSA